MILAFPKQSIQQLQTDWVIINSKNPHTNWEIIKAFPFTTHVSSNFLHSHFKNHRLNNPHKRKKTTQTESDEKDYNFSTKPQKGHFSRIFMRTPEKRTL